MTTTEERVLQAVPGAEAPPVERALSSPGRGGRLAAAAARSLPIVPIVGAVLAWHLLTTYDVIAWLRFDKVPGPLDVFHSLRVQFETAEFRQHVVSSLGRILSGFALASLVGVVVGIGIGRSKVVAALLRPLIEIARPIPAIALVPLAILLFPTSEQGIIFITFFAAVFPVTVATMHAMKTLPLVWMDAASTLGANRRQVLFHIVLPGAMPAIFSGLSVSMGVAWICVVSAEMISGQFGVGYWTWMSYSLLDYAGVVAGMLTIGALGFTTSWLIERLGRRVNRWLPGEAR
ncbi:ABC transporter permease [Promicromonospora panici]|uniref:ABC transporter permease n=1 Tax=Promicromonospora panici TaxID=2219658 RepID=UPI00101BCE58|nr:ABC transporter permease [Promicromonospora panici]